MAPPTVKWFTAASAKPSVLSPEASKHAWAGSTVWLSMRAWVVVSSLTRMWGRSPVGMPCVYLLNSSS